MAGQQGRCEQRSKLWVVGAGCVGLASVFGRQEGSLVLFGCSDSKR